MNDEQLLAAARDEIRTLRRENQIMAAQLDVYETLRALALGPRSNPPMAQDICYEIDKRLAPK
jgi:hypothetical protein